MSGVQVPSLRPIPLEEYIYWFTINYRWFDGVKESEVNTIPALKCQTGVGESPITSTIRCYEAREAISSTLERYPEGVEIAV